MFFRHHFFSEDLLACILFLLVFVVLYFIAFLITIVDNTTVNAEPLNPSIFEKIAPHFPPKVFSHNFVFLLRFLFIFHIFVDFRVPLPPPLGQQLACPCVFSTQVRYLKAEYAGGGANIDPKWYRKPWK